MNDKKYNEFFDKLNLEANSIVEKSSVEMIQKLVDESIKILSKSKKEALKGTFSPTFRKEMHNTMVDIHQSSTSDFIANYKPKGFTFGVFNFDEFRI